MILHAKDVLVRCIQRGYTWGDVQPCIVKDIGNGWYDFDVDHESYPKRPREGYEPPPSLHAALQQRLSELGIAVPSRAPPGVGTELKALLSRIGINAAPACACNQRAKVMDVNGIQWCEENIETICDWLAEEAENRKLPFIRSAGKLLIRMAIRNAKKGISQ